MSTETTETLQEHWREKSMLRDAIGDLTRADYYLGSAARLLEKTSREGWSTDVDRLMKKCIEIREAIHEEVAS